MGWGRGHEYMNAFPIKIVSDSQTNKRNENSDFNEYVSKSEEKEKIKWGRGQLPEDFFRKVYVRVSTLDDSRDSIHRLPLSCGGLRRIKTDTPDHLYPQPLTLFQLMPILFCE